MANDAKSYLTIMLQDNEQLKNYLAGYLNSRLAIKTIHPTKDLETQAQYEIRLSKEMTDQERQALINITSLFRGFAIRMDTNINSLIRRIQRNGEIRLDSIVLEELKTDFKLIENNAAPDYKACKRFVQNVNNFLEDNIDVGQALEVNNQNVETPQALTP